VTLPTYESDGTLTIINNRCQSLPSCPVCGSITNLDQVVINRTAEAGGGRWVAYVLRCVNSVDHDVPHGVRRLKNPDAPLCAFAVPMTLQSVGL
jgi:hypothetical protein